MTVFFNGVRRDPSTAVLLAFAVAATLLQYGAPHWLKEAILPYTGWVGLAVPYSFLIFFAAYSLGTRDHGSQQRMRLACSALLSVGVVLGLAEWAYSGGARPSDNPYLRISSWRPIWTVLVPLLWITVLSGTRPLKEGAGGR